MAKVPFMQVSQLAQLASRLAYVGHGLANEGISASGDAAHSYWLAHRFRCDAWHQRISQHRSAIENCGTSRRTRLWQEITPTLQEVLISEPLTRVVAYLARLLEMRSADADWGALAHSCLSSHVETRHRCLSLMVFGYGLPVERAVGLNRLRRLMEFYTDQLLGSLPNLPNLELYAFEPEAVAETQRDYRRYSRVGPVPNVRLIALTTSLEHRLVRDHHNVAANPRLNASLAEAALGMLPPSLFDSFGTVKSELLSQLSVAIEDTNVHGKDIEQPPAAPFDLISSNTRSEKPNVTRRF